MLATSCLFHAWLKTQYIRPFAYADNWSWMSSRQRAHFQAYQQVLRLTCVMRLSIDHAKSWHWGTKKDFREFCNHLALLHPWEDVSVVIKNAVKDLGEKVNYDKSASLGFIKEKIDEAVTRMHRLEWLHAALQTKTKMLQACVWPLALYSSDTTYIGTHHFTSLRRAALNCLVGKWHNASPVVACFFLSRFLTDPMLHTILQCLRILRRIASVQPELANETILDALSWTGSRPFGPATALRQYLKNLGWELKADGSVIGPDYICFNVLHDSCRRITKLARLMWSHHILGMVDRKGFGDHVPDVATFHRVFHGLTEEEQHLTKFNVVGAFQTAAQKAKWDEDMSDACELCGQPDTREHRLLSCPMLQEIRDGAQHACEVLQHERQEWVYLPIPRAHDQLTIFRAFVMSVKPQEIIAPRNCDLSSMRFFTDGSARYPRHSVARLATWAVVQDISIGESQMRHATDFLFLSPPQFPMFHVSAVGIVPGDQTVARAELYAILHAAKQVNLCEPIPSVEFVTDASYVCRVVDIINCYVFHPILHKFSNGDLIRELAQYWHKDKFKIVKVKSHRKLESATDLLDLWYIVGNMAADAAATLAYQSIPSEVRMLVDEIVAHVEKEAVLLNAHFKFLAAFNKRRCQILEEKKHSETQYHLIRPRAAHARSDGIFHSALMGIDACEAMANFVQDSYVPLTEFLVEDNVLQACLQGENIAKAFVHWSRLVKWPPDIQPDYNMHTKGDWGVSWFELLVSFYLTTGFRCPIKLSGAGAQSEYIDYGDEKATLLPDSKRAVSLQILCFRNLWQNITTVVQGDLLPRFDNYKCFSISRLGFKSPVAGLPCRPIFPNQQLTMKFVWDYIVKLQGSVALHRPLYIKELNILCRFPPLVELTPRERWAKNAALMKRVRASGLGGG